MSETKEAKDKIRTANLQEHLQLFANTWVDRWGDGDLDPEGVAFSMILFLADLESGTDGFTDKPMPQRLVGLGRLTHTIMARSLIQQMGNFFPEAYANKVKDEYKGLSVP